MLVKYHPAAVAELRDLQKRAAGEAAAMLHAVQQLQANGIQLSYPHSSKVRGALRELRPRAGGSPWRGFYQRVGDSMVMAAIGPEAQHDRRGFEATIARALQRLAG
jgi:hypothetical protein